MDQQHASEILAACDRRREERRSFLRMAGQVGTAVAGASLLAACDNDDDTPAPTPTPTATPTPTPPAVSDADVFNFALNLEYLEAQFYNFAAFGVGLPANQLTGTGTQGAVTGGRRVTFTDPVVAAAAREIARNEAAHVAFLRSQLGPAAIAQPAIDISSDPNSAFSNAARTAGLLTGTTTGFDPYFSDENFLLAGYLFEDVGVTAYKGASVLISNPTFLEAAAGILAVEGYHAGTLRTFLYRKGLTTPSLLAATEGISNARDSLDGPSDLDQGVTGTGVGTATPKSNIVPTDASGIAFSRTTGQVLNIVYLNGRSVSSGGFFPAGVNGAIRTSAQSV